MDHRLAQDMYRCYLLVSLYTHEFGQLYFFFSNFIKHSREVLHCSKYDMVAGINESFHHEEHFYIFENDKYILFITKKALTYALAGHIWLVMAEYLCEQMYPGICAHLSLVLCHIDM